MKKVFSILLLILLSFCTACSMNDNNPEEVVESLFERYRSKDDSIIEQLKDTINGENLLDNQKKDYQMLMEKQYDSLGYVIKDKKEEDGVATVIVEITVLDYKAQVSRADEELKTNPEKFNDENGNFSEHKYMDYKIELKLAIVLSCLIWYCHILRCLGLSKFLESSTLSVWCFKS